MIPVVDDELLTLEDETQPSLTYALDAENGRIRGKVDGLEAVKQAVYLALSTERFAHLIYSWRSCRASSGMDRTQLTTSADLTMDEELGNGR